MEWARLVKKASVVSSQGVITDRPARNASARPSCLLWAHSRECSGNFSLICSCHIFTSPGTPQELRCDLPVFSSYLAGLLACGKQCL